MILKAPPIKAPNIREIVPVKINEFISLNSFKKEIRNWVLQNCPCRFRKQYISGVGFLPCLVVFFIFKDFYVFVLIF